MGAQSGSGGGRRQGAIGFAVAEEGLCGSERGGGGRRTVRGLHVGVSMCMFSGIHRLAMVSASQWKARQQHPGSTLAAPWCKSRRTTYGTRGRPFATAHHVAGGGLLRGQLHALGCEEAAGAARACQKRETAPVMSCKHRRSHEKRRQGLG